MKDWFYSIPADKLTAYMKTVSEIQVVSVLLLTACFLGVFLCPFLSKKSTAIISGAAGCICSTVLYYILPLGGVEVVGISMIIILLFTFYREKKNGLFRQKIFLFVVYFSLYILVAGVMSQFSFFTTNLFYNSDTDVFDLVVRFTAESVLYVVLAFVLLYFGQFFLKKIYHSHRELSNLELFLLLLPECSVFFARSIVISYIQLYNQGIADGSIKSNIPGNLYHLLYYIFSYFVVLAQVYLYEKIKAHQEEISQNIILQKQMEEIREQVGRVERYYGELRAVRHDIGNHLQTIGNLLEGGEKESAVSYMKKMKEEYEFLPVEIKSGNPVTDVILTEKMRRAKEQGIYFESNFIFPERMKIDAFDLSILLHNAIDNAIEAADAASDKKRIAVFSSVNQSVFLIRIENSSSGQLFVNKGEELPRTTKAEPGHGMGLKLILRTAKKYDGDIRLSQEGDTVTLEIMLQGRNS